MRVTATVTGPSVFRTSSLAARLTARFRRTAHAPIRPSRGPPIRRGGTLHVPRARDNRRWIRVHQLSLLDSSANNDGPLSPRVAHADGHVKVNKYGHVERRYHGRDGPRRLLANDPGASVPRTNRSTAVGPAALLLLLELPAMAGSRLTSAPLIRFGWWVAAIRVRRVRVHRSLGGVCRRRRSPS